MNNNILRTNTKGLGKSTPLNQRAEWYRWNDLITYIFSRKNNFPKNLKILDVGCGDCLLAKYIYDKNVELGSPKKIYYVGLDSYRPYKKSPYLIDGKIIIGDLKKITTLFTKKSFDIAVASEIIEHIDETDDLIINIRKVLKPNGVLYLTTPNLACWHSRILLMFGILPLPMEVSNVRGGFGKGLIHKLYSGGLENETVHHIRCFTLSALLDFIKFHQYVLYQVRGGAYSRFTNVIFSHLPALAPVIKLICFNK